MVHERSHARVSFQIVDGGHAHAAFDAVVASARPGREAVRLADDFFAIEVIGAVSVEAAEVRGFDVGHALANGRASIEDLFVAPDGVLGAKAEVLVVRIGPRAVAPGIAETAFLFLAALVTRVARWQVATHGAHEAGLARTVDFLQGAVLIVRAFRCTRVETNR
jgi:hypothetical protein